MYKVGRETPNSGEREIAAFLHLTDARRFIAACLAEEEYNNDFSKRYHLYDVNGNRCESHRVQIEDDDEPASYSSGSSPAPTPTLRPPGSPPVTRRIHENPEDEDD